MRRNWLFFVAVALVPAGTLLDWYAFAVVRENVAVVPLEACLLGLIPLYLFRHLGWRKAPILSAPEWSPVFLFAAWSAYSLLLAGQRFHMPPHEVIVSGLFLGRWSAYAVLYFFMCDLGIREQGKALQILVLGALMFALFGIFQSVFLPNFAFDLLPAQLGYFVPDVQGHRLVSTLLDPNIAGGFIDVFALLALSLYLYGQKIWFWVFLPLITALVMTFSRGSIGGFVVGAAVLTFSRGVRRDKFLWVLMVCGVFAAAGWPLIETQLAHFHKLGISDASAQTRFQDWRYAALMFRRNWLFGIGYNTFGYVSELFGIARSGGSAFGFAGDLFLIPVTTGIVGAALYAWILARVWASAAKILRGTFTPWEKGFASGVRAGMVSCVVCSLFTAALLYTTTMAALWLLWAHLHTLARGPRPVPARPAGPSKGRLVSA